MNQALVELVLHAVNEKYVSEKAFYREKLGISAQSWDRWKKGEQGLKYENIQILANLFTDYEWMLVQKVVRNAEILTDVMQNPVGEYIFLKYQISQTWLNNGIARVEWGQTDENEEASLRKSNTVILRLVVDYHFWGYNDIIEFRLPGVIQQQIGHDQVRLLQWIDDQSDRLREASNKE
ncbi:hypothetical protein CL176_01505 [Suicoccus acidiformans]|uniref:Uncharacterized protein n=1 Tax=Suicoccus acidiformans TaxID=2036206 RepID=A0A347WI90_9LACT|nr:hypothetical protein [Suicoccus acidiformans]AXY24797.1 hypothetical protein CL176_01505 [Suicoccus acidiformans]